MTKARSQVKNVQNLYTDNQAVGKQQTCEKDQNKDRICHQQKMMQYHEKGGRRKS